MSDERGADRTSFLLVSTPRAQRGWGICPESRCQWMAQPENAHTSPDCPRLAPVSLLRFPRSGSLPILRLVPRKMLKEKGGPQSWASSTCRGGGLPWCSDSKESACSAGDPVPSLYGKVPWRRAWQPTPVFVPGESHGQRSLVGYSPWGCKESDTTEQLTHTHTHTHTTQPAGWCPETAKSLPNKLCVLPTADCLCIAFNRESPQCWGNSCWW